MAADAPAVRLPYPHTRNDCVMCRERDADFHVLGEGINRPETGYRALLCQGCLGKFLVTRGLYSRGRDVPLGDPFTVELVLLAPDRKAW